MPFTDDAGSWAKKRTTSHPFRFDEGVTIWVAETDVQPDDDFLSA